MDDEKEKEEIRKKSKTCKEIKRRWNSRTRTARTVREKSRTSSLLPERKRGVGRTRKMARTKMMMMTTSTRTKTTRR